MLGLQFRGQACCVEDRVFPELLGQFIDGAVYPGHLLYFCRIVKEGVLDLRLRKEAGKDYPCLAVEAVSLINMVEPLPQCSKEVDGIGGWTAQFDLYTAPL